MGERRETFDGTKMRWVLLKCQDKVVGSCQIICGALACDSSKSNDLHHGESELDRVVGMVNGSLSPPL